MLNTLDKHTTEGVYMQFHSSAKLQNVRLHIQILNVPLNLRGFHRCLVGHPLLFSGLLLHVVKMLRQQFSTLGGSSSQPPATNGINCGTVFQRKGEERTNGRIARPVGCVCVCVCVCVRVCASKQTYDSFLRKSRAPDNASW